ncbi:MAG: DUF2784 family protein [Thermodesulfobacteriota bacterium]
MKIWRMGGELLNIFLHGVHLVIVVFSIFGWLFEATRGLHLLLLIGTLVYWYGFGPIFRKKGWYGHCLVTDLQWGVKKWLGHNVPPWGYIKYLADLLAGHETDEELVNRVTLIVFFSSLVLSAVLFLVPFLF